jgi:hypothetical protein
MTASRHRTFSGVFYPESAPENFREVIAGWTVPALLVLHDQDEDKKPHYHLLMLFSGKKSLGQARELMHELGSEVVQPAWDTRAAARYLAHLDQPEKFQYPVSVIEAFSGASVLDLTAPVGDPSPEILAFIRDQGLIEYAGLIDYCLDHRSDWYRWASAHSIFLCAYLRSCRHAGHVED